MLMEVMIRKVTKTHGSAHDQGEISVIVEPRSGHTDEEVASALKEAGASSVDVLCPGFISASATAACLSRIKSIASVHRKTTKQLHAE